MANVKAVAFMYLSPEALREIFRHKGYRVAVMNQDLVLREQKRNLVLLLDLRQIDKLVQHAPLIHRVAIVTRGRHEDAVARGIPLLDAVQVEGVYQCAEVKTAEQYCRAIEDDAVDLELEAPAASAVPSKAPKPTRSPQTLAEYLDFLQPQTGECFGRCFEVPACCFCLGLISKQDYRQALKAAITEGVPDALVRQFYNWTRQYRDLIEAAVKAAVRQHDLDEVADRYGVPLEDLKLLVKQYHQRKEVPNGKA